MQTDQSTIVAVTGILKDEDILGYLEFHQVPDMRVAKEDMNNLWNKHGLDVKYLPAKIFPADAFRRATATANTGFIEITSQKSDSDNPGTMISVKYSARLLVREVVNDDNFIVRHLIREVVDSKNEVLFYHKVGAWRFDKKLKKVEDSVAKSLLTEYPYDNIVNGTTQLVDEFLNYHTRDTVRNLIMKVIRDSNPTPIMSRSQGKFIPKQHTQNLQGMKTLLEELGATYAPGSDCNMDLIPIVNTIEQRDMLNRKASMALKEEAENLIEEFAQIMTGKTEIKESVAKRLITNALTVKDRIKEYENLLNIRMNAIEDQLKHFVDNIRITPSDK